MSKENRTCYTCGEKYYYCPTCPSKAKKETYYNMFHNERCSQIFKLLTDETFKHITTAECKAELLKLNVSTEEKFKPSVNEHIQKVFSTEIVLNEAITEEVFESIPSEQTLVEKTEDSEEPEVLNEALDHTQSKMKYVSKKRKRNSEVDY